LFLSIFFQDKKLDAVVSKNIITHQRRNSKTALVFSITIAFLIFVSTGFRLQKRAITELFEELVGSDIKIQTNLFSGLYLDEQGLKNYLENYKIKYPSNI